jgi:curved DNA-binding protein CbpA
LDGPGNKVQGLLSDRLIPDLIREISAKDAGGLLRIARGKMIKAIFFEKGAPVFAISNLGSDQLERRLTDQALATPEQIQRAKQRADKPHRLGPVLVEMRILSDSQMRKLVREQVMEIILSLFELTQGEYTFDEKIRASHDVTLDISVAEILLQGARRAALNEQAAAALAPPDGVVQRTKTSNMTIDAGRLIPLESYVLSRIDAPTQISEIGSLSGIPEEDAYKAVCALLGAGFLKLAVEGRDDPQSKEDEEELQRVRDDVTRKLHFFQSADYYEILGVTRHSSPADIKAAYYKLAKKFHPDRYRQLEDADFRGKLDSLFSVIAAAYETLIEPPRRASYDDRLRKSSGSQTSTTITTSPLPQGEPVRPAPTERAHVKHSAPLPSNNGADADSLGNEAPAVEFQSAGVAAGAGDHSFHGNADMPAADLSAPKSAAPALNADQLFSQGKARFERKEYHAAVHLFREAIKLDPSRAPYHFHLGVALIRNPRTRREAEEHLAKAAQLDPYSAQMRLKLGMLYKESGLNKKAEAYFKEALKLDPESKIANRELGNVSGQGKDSGHSIWKSDIGSFAKKIFKK